MAEVPFYDLGRNIRARRGQLHVLLDQVIDGGYFIGGELVNRFESDFAAYLRAEHCVAVGNGLDALRIALEALGVGPGDEVIVPGFTFYATWLAVTELGAVPVPADVDAETAAIDPLAVSAVITSRTRAVIVVHLFGIPADMTALRRVTDSAGIVILEDAAQSHGAMSGGQMTGTLGDAAGFSFYPTKNLGALGDAGAIVTSSDEVARIARRRRSYGQGASKYEHVDSGWNSRLDSMQAAFLTDALLGLDAEIEVRRGIAARYLDAMGPRASSVVGSRAVDAPVWHQFVLRTVDRAAVRDHLDRAGIASDIHYPYAFDTVEPLLPYAVDADLPTSRSLADSVLSVPMGSWLQEDEVGRVADALGSLPPGSLDET